MKNIEKLFEGEHKEELIKYIIKNCCPNKFNLEQIKLCNGCECVRCWNKEVD